MPLKFVDRHNGPREQEEKQMLKVLGVSTIDELIGQTVPQDILLKEPLKLDAAVTEHDYTVRLKEIAAKNKNFRSLIGMGFYGTASPAVITRNIFENPSWYTSYTPYQAEISQGRLEALINFQTMVSSLTGFSLANCSMLDDATAAAEAMRMMYELRSRDAVKAGKNVIFVDDNVFPQVLSVLKTRAWGLGIEIHTGDFASYEFEEKCYGAFVQFPAANGEVRDYSAFAAKAHAAGCLVSAYVDILSLAVLKEPAAWGADIVCGSAQRFGLPMGFGGPVAGFMACSDTYKRNLPGRIIGISVDRLGKNAVRLALQTREQHIKREKATSNICTATALMATMTGMFAIWHGPEGIRQIALNARGYAHAFAGKLKEAGYKLSCDNFFDTIEIVGAPVEQIRKKALEAGFNFFYTENGRIRISFDELSSCAEAKALGCVFGCKEGCPTVPDAPEFMARETPILTQKVFNSYHCETEMMRYIKKLERKDISLTHSMIPLGSCTMKLNAAVEMMPLSWAELGNVHPFAPADQCEGSLQIIRELEHDLAVITGFDGCSLQPNSGAAGEYAGLMTIRNYLHANGGDKRNVMIIPTSAHGTNPASAAMAGFDIVLVSCDGHGNINVDELREKAAAAGENLAGMMITYPSTHGVFEVKIREIMDIIHSNGGLVYMDGANMNAQVGLTNPGIIGADVCHLNLHKTFAMPHGGGGPGVGPICTAKKLTPYLPGHPVVEECGGKGITAVGAAPYGSPLLLPITHAYIKLLGPDGLRKASAVAILNANYMSAKLLPELKTLYTGATGRVAHECIIDLQHFRAEYGVDATDVAKRLMDFGFHAPTLSFPVHETLMIEPTESEPLGELDRFVEALKTIVAECEAIKSGKLDKEDNPVKMAPHTAEEVCSDNWNHSYSREQAAYPLGWIRENKFWPASSRVDNGYGDRNLVTVVE
ncbi:MAG: aminomethyl-transferring glycine dehydrogenase [Bacteroidales bacterium]|nr:aminomethyl-transferring glycine dehydrogenase [Candidatus Cacconaster caballi]